MMFANSVYAARAKPFSSSIPCKHHPSLGKYIYQVELRYVIPY